jgi:carbonic anhydrase
MANRLGLDQKAAWIIAIISSSAVFSGGYSLLKRITKNHTEAVEHSAGTEEGGHGEDHEKSDSADHGDHATKGHQNSDDHESKHEESSHGNEQSQQPGDDHKDLAHSQAVEKHDGPKHDVHWTYEGENGPGMWGKLSPNFVDCQDGHKQSPINFENIKSQQELRPLMFSYMSSKTKLENNGHTIGPKFDPGNYLTFNGERFGLVGFHYHMPSEHLVGGVPYEMEIHLVHKNEHGNLAVVGIFVEEGGHSNSLLEKISMELPTKAGSSGPDTMINPKDFLPDDTAYFAYPGSLTTPPCSEGVQWLVVKKSIRASSKQIGMFADRYHNNARPAQPLHGRTIARSASR